MTNLQTITKEELANIDLDIFTLMEKLPKNKLYNSLYIRMDKTNNEVFSRILCEEDELINLLASMICKDSKFRDLAKHCFLNLAIGIVKEDNLYDSYSKALKQACK